MAGNRLLLRQFVRVLSVLAVALSLLTTSGCGKKKLPPPEIVPVEGVVTLEGQPLKQVRVRFVPVSEYDSDYSAVGTTDDTGHFTLYCHGQQGACSGDNIVTIEEGELPKELSARDKRMEAMQYFEKLGGRPLPPQYASLAKSTLLINVSSKKGNYTIPLTRESETN